jgi:hypothetical protein
MTIVHKLQEHGLISPPKWLPDNLAYLVIMGSMAYGVNTDTSDMDVYGFAVPPKEIVFPHLTGYIPGFGNHPEKFDQWSEHHIRQNQKEYDFSVYSIVRYFDLCRENNPNMIDSLFVPDNCVMFQSKVGEIVRENKHAFLHKGAFHKYKGYAYAQIGRYKSLSPESKLGSIRIKMGEEGLEFDAFKEKVDSGELVLSASMKRDFDGLNERQINTIKEGVDRKAMYHVVRLMNELEQILTTGTLDLQINREQLKSIRRGEWTPEQIFEYFERKEAELDGIQLTSNVLPHGPNMKQLHSILVSCLEEVYGSLDNMISQNKDDRLLVELKGLVKKFDV